MTDADIIELYFARNECAVAETDRAYGAYCRAIVGRILRHGQDREECMNDVYLNVWNTIPPQRPKNFRLFLGAIARNVALDMLDYNRAKKRGDGARIAMEEFASCIPDGKLPADELLALREAINDFLGSLDARARIIFLRRYWYMCSLEEIAASFSLSLSNVKVILHRTRRKFAARLKKEGFFE